MSVFITISCAINNTETTETFANEIAWSKLDSILAVSSNVESSDPRDAHKVHFINNEGKSIPFAEISHDRPATAMDWKPNGKCIAIGWSDGMISCWNVDGRSNPTSTFSNASVHNAPITLVKWNSDSKRVISGDMSGTICVWTVDARGSLSASRGGPLKKKSPITSAVYCMISTRPEVRKGPDMRHTYSASFFFGTEQGNLVYADDLGYFADVKKLNSAIDIMLFFEEKSRLVVITKSLLLTQYHVAEDGKISEAMQAKLSVPSGNITAEKGIRSVTWTCPGLLAIATYERFIRMLDLAAEESYNLSLSAVGETMDRLDVVSCVSFSIVDRYLAVGTQKGFVVMWKFNGPIREVKARGLSKPTSASDWELVFKTSIANEQGPIDKQYISRLSWHGGRGTVAALTGEGDAIMLSEMVLHNEMCGDLSVIQTDTTQVSVVVGGAPETISIDVGMLIKGLAVAKSSFVVWSGKSARVIRMDTTQMRYEMMSIFETPGTSFAIADDISQVGDEALYMADQSLVRVLNFTGVQRNSISFSEAEGLVEHIHVYVSPTEMDPRGNSKKDSNAKNILAVMTNKGNIGTYDISKKCRPIGSIGLFPDASNLKVRNIKINARGTRLAILADYCEGALQVRHPDPRLHIYDCAKGSVYSFDFTPMRRSPTTICWDDNDDRVLACEATKLRSLVLSSSASSVPSTSNPSSEGEMQGDNEVEVYLFFATSEHGIFMQDSFPRKAPYGPLLAISVPRVFFRNSVNIEGDGSTDPDDPKNVPNQVKIFSKVMRDFIGIEDITPSVKQGLLDFSYNLTLGKLDEAYRAVKTIGSVSIWENMAYMCVKTKRLDVAEVCLGNMGHARGAAALRESKKERSNEYSLGVLAIHLGLLDDAVRLFKEGGHFGMLNKLYQAAGLWNKAIKIANTSDRIHLKTTHYNYARNLESRGDIDAAIKHYELSETGKTEIPRMLFSVGRIDELEDYVNKSEDISLLKWWAAYLESVGRLDVARKYYNKSGDFLSLVRILCFKGDFNKAAEIVHESGDKASAYHFARQLESQGEYQEAINFYSDSGCYNHSIRLARAYGLDAELMRFALKSSTSYMLDCASHFEGKGEYDKAVQLYHKGGDLPRALDLCFRGAESNPSQSGAMFDMVNEIAQDLGKDTSPQTLARCAEFLVRHQQFPKAIELYVLAKRLPQAIEMCLQHKVTIDEALVEKLTPPESLDPSERKDTLKELAKALKKQGAFSLASKKYTQAGDRVRAIKCLVRSGDTKAVIQFATISRNAEIYKLAANYLQQMNWRESVDIMKAIVMFYTKAQSFEQLAGFYDSCGQVEIDEYRDYEKAIGAMKEALKYLAKANTSTSADMAADVERRIVLIEKFVQAKKMAKRDPDTMVTICEALLQEPMLEDAVRSGDCFSMLVEHFHSKGMLREAYAYMQDMKDRRIPLASFIDQDIIEEIYKAVGMSKGGGGIAGRGGTGMGGKVARADSQSDYGGGRSAGSGRGGGRSDDEDAVDEDLDEEIGEEEEEVEDFRGRNSTRNQSARRGGGNRK